MLRNLIQILIVLAIFVLYYMFSFSAEKEPYEYIIVSNLIGICFSLTFIVEIKSNKFLKKQYFKAFSLNHTNLIIQRISLFYKKFYLWGLIIIPPLLLFFINNVSLTYLFTIYLLSVFQNIFTIYLLISLYDFIENKGFEKHIYTLPAILSIFMTFLRYDGNPDFFFINPFGGIINLPILYPNPISYLIPAALFIALYFFNTLFVHNNWVNG